MRATDQIRDLDGPKREDRYDRTELDRMPLGKATTSQIRDYLACRTRLEEHLDEESVFAELCRLSRQADSETQDVFDRIHLRVGTNPGTDLYARIRAGMLEDGWAEYQITYAISTLSGSADAA